MNAEPSAQPESKIWVTENPPVRTQFQIFTIFGDYLLDRGGRIWTSSLLALMDQIGVSERAVRAALSRMRRKEWIDTRRQARMSEYLLTERGQILLKRGQQRIFEQAFSDWDRQWHLVIYSLPEKKRKLRQILRTQLAWLGYGQLAPGTWISPRDRAGELAVLVAELDAEEFVDMFAGQYLGPSKDQALLARSWDLESLEGQYKEFISKYQNGFRRLEKLNSNGNEEISPEKAFVERFWLTHDFQSFPLSDPNLPVELLPQDWAGTTARQMFIQYHKLLGRYAEKFVAKLLAEQEEKVNRSKE